MCIVCDPARKEEMEAATTVALSGCANVVRVPALPSAKALFCARCPSLVTFSVLSNLTSLFCFNCPNLTTIPAMPNLVHLFCYNGPNLTTIHELPKLERLDCAGCPLLTALPKLSMLHDLNCDDWIDHPLNERFPVVQKAARTLARRRLKKLRWVRFKKFISTPQHSAYLNSPGHVGHRIETAQLRKLGSERT